MSGLVKLSSQQNLLQTCFSVRCLHFSSIIFSISHKHKYCTVSNKEENPLLGLKGLPVYQKITGEAIDEAVPELIKNAKLEYKKFEEMLDDKKTISWDDVIPYSEKLMDQLSLAWGSVQHLHGVKNNPGLREAYQKVLPDFVSFASKVSQSKPVYNALKVVDGQKDTLDEAQQRIVDSALQSAKLSGVHLEGEKKEQFTSITQELADLSTKFQNNVLDSTKAFSHIIKDPKDLEGLPSSLKSLMAMYASQELNETMKEEKGPWKLSLDMPCYEPFMKYSMNPSLREMLYTSYISRASNGNHDNSRIIDQIRHLRRKKSQILGFNTFAELSVSRKMAKTPDAVWKMVKDLAIRAKPVAEKELKTLQAFAASHGFEGTLRHWDLAYWSEKQKEHLLMLNEEMLRQYFPLPKVLTGLFSLLQEIFDIKIVETSNTNVWHEDVKFYNIYNQAGEHIASFFLDMYSRPSEKQGGAWMGHALGFNKVYIVDRDDSMQRKPVAYMVCNQSPPVGDRPSLMTFREVTTLFHEVGTYITH